MADEPQDLPVEGLPVATDPPPGGVSDVAALQRERDELQDRLLRKSAEFENYRKRVERERREQADRAVVELLSDLLVVVDDFDRALAAAITNDDTATYRQGVALIHAKLQDLLRRKGVHPIEVLGADFDPNVHEAVMQEPSPGHREGEVVAELQKGYRLGDRLLRPAKVKVATA
jgi:molecular chaperone GrpE